MVFFGFLMAGGRAHRKLKGSLLLSLALFAAFAAAGCNSISGSPHGSTPTPKPAPTLVTYTVLVTGTANGIIHNAKITVVVP
jgi:hypothetical protein